MEQQSRHNIVASIRRLALVGALAVTAFLARPATISSDEYVAPEFAASQDINTTLVEPIGLESASRGQARDDLTNENNQPTNTDTITLGIRAFYGLQAAKPDASGVVDNGVRYASPENAVPVTYAPGYSAEKAREESLAAQENRHESFTSFMPNRFVAPSIGLDSRIESLVSTRDETGTWRITPKEETHADLKNVSIWYEQNSKIAYTAKPASPDYSEGTMFLYAHACRTLDICAGNTWSDFKKGDTFEVQGEGDRMVTVTITANPKLLDKTVEGVSNSKETYQYNEPGRVEMFTCAYSEDGTSTQNWFITGQITS